MGFEAVLISIMAFVVSVWIAYELLKSAIRSATQSQNETLNELLKTNKRILASIGNDEVKKEIALEELQKWHADSKVKINLMSGSKKRKKAFEELEEEYNEKKALI